MTTVNIRAAKTQLSRLVDAVAAGEEVIIARAGSPVARLVPIEPPQRAKRQLGLLDDQFNIPEDFDTMFADEILERSRGADAHPPRYQRPSMGDQR